jgi:fumarate hydratase, class I
MKKMWSTEKLKEPFVELIRRASTDLPQDIEEAMKRARDNEQQGSLARSALDQLLENVVLARERSAPMCQDTGTNIWYVRYPRSASQRDIRDAILAATREATNKSYLRPNAVCSLTGKNSGDNTGAHAPVIHLDEWDEEALHADLLLKGGGCENVSTQYAIPHQKTGAGRDLEGVRRVVIDAIVAAQGKGCAPGYLGICIGGDRLTSHLVAKEMIFRRLEDNNPRPELAELEARLMSDLNSLKIGPMGFGGKTTVLGVKIGTAHRLPASYFVSIAYECWACRRASVRIEDQKVQFGQQALVAEEFLAAGGA